MFTSFWFKKTILIRLLTALNQFEMQWKGNKERKRGQNIGLGASFSIRPPEITSWSPEKFFLLLRSLFVCVWEREKKKKRMERLHENRRHLCHCFLLQLHRISFFAHIFPLWLPVSWLLNALTRLKWTISPQSDVERPAKSGSYSCEAQRRPYMSIHRLLTTPWFPWESADVQRPWGAQLYITFMIN